MVETPLGLGIEGSESPRAVAGALWRALEANPAIGIEAAVLAAAAMALPYARRRGLAGIGVYGACVVAGALAVPLLAGAGMVEPIPLVVGTLVVCAVAAVPALRDTWSGRREHPAVQ